LRTVSVDKPTWPVPLPIVRECKRAGAIVGVRAATQLLVSGMADAVAEVLLF
jgi:hypothetical protein